MMELRSEISDRKIMANAIRHIQIALRFTKRVRYNALHWLHPAYTTAIMLVIVPLTSFASEVFPTIEYYVTRSTGKSALEFVIHTSKDYSSKPISPVFGIAHGNTYGNRTAFVFVLDEVASGGFRETAVSPLFDFSDHSARTDVAWVEAQSADRFFIGFNSRAVCGIHRNVYRFARARGKWHVAELDRSDSVCTDDGTLGVGNSLSINHLTGRLIEEQFKNHRLISSHTSYKQFPNFPLSKFSVFDERYRAGK